jgi:hypothetical protein
MQIHLDDATYRQLRAGELDAPNARVLAEHLDGSCAVCEAFLASRAVDGLDGAVDATLARLAPSSADTGHDVEYARIRRALRSRGTGARRVTGWAAAVAALLLVGGVAVAVARHARPARVGEAAWDGVKGRPGQALPARLRFAVVEAAGAAPRIDRGRSGAVVPADSSLAFRVELGLPAYVALLRVGGGEGEVIWTQRAAQPGVLDVSQDGHPAAYPLRGLVGMQRFALVASESPIGPDDLAAAARAAAEPTAGVDDPRRGPLTLDVVEVTVR